MNALVGCTGFVGSNLCRYGKFDRLYHSPNIEEAYGLNPDLLVYAGVRAEKYLANTYPEKDLELIKEAEKNIELIRPKKLVLISTIDVLKETDMADEDCRADSEGMQAYGRHRLLLEKWVRDNEKDALIIRLPALFGVNIRKNFIYDYVKKIPFMVKKDKMQGLTKKCPELTKFYEAQENDFYKCKELTKTEREQLKNILEKLEFNALHFTDSRSKYQFYPLKRLWKDIGVLLEHNVLLWHPATEPVSAGELFYYLEGKPFVNEITDTPADYNFITKYAALFGEKGKYICRKEEILREIKQFVREETGL